MDMVSSTGPAVSFERAIAYGHVPVLFLTLLTFAHKIWAAHKVSNDYDMGF